MKIVQVYPKLSGGLERYINNLTYELVEAEEGIQFYNFVVYFKGQHKNENVGHSPRINYTSIEVDRGMQIEFSPLMDCINPNLEKAFSSFLDKIEPDIVHFQHIYGLSASLIGVAKEKGIKIVFTVHDYWTICPRLFLLDGDLMLCEGPNLGAKCFRCTINEIEYSNHSLLSSFLLRYQFMKNMLQEKVDVIVAVSKMVKSKLVEENIPEKKIVVSYPSVAVGERLAKKKKANITFGFIGNLNVHKGPHVLISAFNRIESNNKELHFYGSANPLYNATIKQLAKDNKKIIFHGAYDKQSLPSIFANIDVLVVPSICMETGPLVVQEALKHNVPVIASNIGSIPEYVKGEYGKLFEAGNIDELESIMKFIISSPQILERWRNAIPKLADVQDFVNESYSIYSRLLEGEKENKVKINKQHLEVLNKSDYAFLRQFSVPNQLKNVVRMLFEKGYLHIGIFGAGELGEKIFQYVQQRGIRVKAFIDNDKTKWSRTCAEIPIISPADISLFQMSAILVASDWEMEILKQLDDLNLGIPIIGLYSFS
ncbi:glycosyltransferase [Aneurinibacillus migulanus]|uniref:Glycosyltransferase involved in cell wall bisynthesis n=1 Tax=Aneurinibacillus migulanus TaxID=47500 RepID=A0A0D1XDH8_ANEMI|nr:glycosyltransferase [Aneurinibacillus migulanus]KIV52441.1 hypothetical protein TS65_23855 [Aneurinibacillus migulanus]KON94617.1 hypothetical protein AF333_03030 [Aneurinibacillus migulanus]MED0892666.1 glycosyltransferase [Aneurinibacillus migulanus]MED1614307.1 glycosyltransferase [Aneurinibacillus migulanus]SDI48128.1 Glycosyltransferase involved in cell wall bisynthesis [Aneurinibacillus migulanus]